MAADLHIHTTASDGQMSVDEIVLQAEKCGLSYIAITDHDTIDGVLSLQKLYKTAESNLVVIPGIEFSTDLPNYEVHILGYYISLSSNQLLRQISLLTANRRERVRLMVAKLNQLGYALTEADVMSLAGTRTAVGRPYVAKAMVEKGYFPTVAAVFEKLLYKNGPAYISHYRLSPQQAIDLIKKAGGIPVLAHPGLIGDDDVVLDIIKQGIRGLEVYHPTHNKMQTEKYAKLAIRHKLVITGGSDFHGIAGRYPESLGVFTVDDRYARELHAT